MDIPRPSQAKAKLRKRLLLAGAGALVLIAISFGISRLKPAAPVLERSQVWIDTVKQGLMVRQVRGLGTLLPEDIRFITARTSARVERIVLRPGALVEPDSIILELVNPEVVQAAEAADSQLGSAESDYTNLRVRLESELLAMEAGLARAKSEFETSKLQAEVNESLFKDGLVSSLEKRRTQVAAEDAALRHELEKRRYAFTQESMKLQLSVKQSEVARVRATAALRREDCDALHVRAGMKGMLQTLSLEVGQQLAPGSIVAKVADPLRLRAEIRIPETQAKDVQPGQSAVIDTRNGLVEGRVTRVDPSVQNGTVTVDVALTGTLPKGARPDLSVDGVVELERLENVLHVGRPAFGQERNRTNLYLVNADGSEASRISVQLGRSSVNTIEIVDGLRVGDRIILSDMTQWEGATRVRLR